MRRIISTGLLLGSLYAAQAFALSAGQPMPDFKAATMAGGSTLSLKSLRGKVVYVDFWASWCAPCRISMPLLDQLRGDFSAQGFEVLGVNVDEDVEQARRAWQQAAVRYPNVRGLDDQVLTQFDIQKMPAAYLVDRKGQVRQMYQGFRVSDMAAIRADVESLLKEKTR